LGRGKASLGEALKTESLAQTKTNATLLHLNPLLTIMIKGNWKKSTLISKKQQKEATKKA
jgi:hypothetical protein